MCLRNRSLVSWWLINLGTVENREIEFDCNHLRSDNRYFTCESCAAACVKDIILLGYCPKILPSVAGQFCSATSGETAGVEELVLTLATTALLRD
ncbi:hypothetical protein Tco_0575338 [Tanacetum coccineum]